MRKFLLLLLFAAFVIACLVWAVDKFHTVTEGLLSPEEKITLRMKEPVLGVYSPSENLTEEEAFDIQHYGFTWTSPRLSDGDLLKLLPKEKDLLITIELRDEPLWGHHYGTILNRIVEGDYDGKIRNFCNTLATRQQEVYLRWNPEMEVPVQLLPWQYQPPGRYIRAFRHFSALCQSTAPNVKIVWGTAAYPGALEWWPGEDVVDIVSISPLSKSTILATSHPLKDSLPLLLRRQLHRLRFIDKPVLVLGTERIGQRSFNQEWLERLEHELQPFMDPLKQSANGITKASSTAKEKKKPSLLIGLYDPEEQLVSGKAVSVEHLFTDLAELRSGRFREKFKEVLERDHEVVVTMEPWKGAAYKRDPAVLAKTLNGHYDAEIEELYRVIASSPKTVYLRWAHEMEIPIERYDWQSQDPIQYIKAYRYFASFLEPRPEHIKMVWGPAGDRGSPEWWPGEDVVDFIGISIYGLPDKNITHHKKQNSFADVLRQKYYRMRFLNKPIFITEMGVKGPDEFQQVWLQNAAETLLQYPDIVGVCYFNHADVPEAWGKIAPPDWSISEESFKLFAKTLTDPN
ncbi:glycoside hydrolase family 26 protein [Nafulsella turpanensis]|uniref:hypothetical protein n=1 Tax=Nafulsella turpanensis TaxID=1265690 RepID=UPI00034A47BF|nr:hypothetical protein [Nafulsella turpanensis]